MAADENRRITIYINGQEVEFSLKNISKSMRQARSDLRNMTIGTEEYNKKAKELAALEGVYKKHTQALNNAGKSSGFFAQASSGLKSTLGSLLSPANLLLGGVAALGGIFMSGVNKMREFESALDNLSARTGFTGSDIDTLKKKAIEMSKSFAVAPKAIVDAFAEAASARPELMASTNALAQFTESAIILSKVTKTDLQGNIADLSTIMNTNNIATKDTAKTVEILVGASQKGAKEIPFLSTAMQKVGGTAANANVGLAEQAAVIELLGEKYSNSAETVGTNTRNILIQLQKDWNTAKDGPFNLKKALDNLAPAVGNITTMTEMFGKENVVAAQTLVQNRDRLSELTTSISEYTGASDVARTQQDNLDGALNSLSARWDALWADMSDGNGVITWVIRSFEGVIYMIEAAGEAIHEAFSSNEQLTQEAMAKGRQVGKEGESRRIQRAIDDGPQAANELLNKAIERQKTLVEGSEQYKRTQDFILEIQKAINDKAIEEGKIQQAKNAEAKKASAEQIAASKKLKEESVTKAKEKTRDANEREGIAPIAMRGMDGELQFTKDVEAAKTAVIMDATSTRIAMENALKEEAFQQEIRREEQQAKEIAAAKESITRTTIDTAFALADMSVDKRKNRELKSLESQKEQGIITEKQYAAKKESIEKEAFQRKKRLDIAEILMNGVVAGSKTVAQLGFIPAIPALAALAAQTLGQVALVAAQEYGDGGLVKGPSHSDGGVPAIMEGNEFVVKKSAVNATTLPMLEAINGGKIVYMNAGQATANTMMDSSGVSRSVQSRNASASSSSDIKVLVDKVDQWQSEFEVSLPLRKLEKSTERKSRIDKLAKAA